jgi:hypothetical protein
MTPDPFTWAQYEGYLGRAHSCGYRFSGFGALADDAVDAEHPVIYLRHDIDFSLRWVLPMAELEHRHGVRSTYCFLLDSQNYSSTTDAFDRTVDRVLELGHWLGLHFDANAHASDDEIAQRVADGAASLEGRFGADVAAVSFHMPGRRSVSHIELPGRLVNTYGPRFFADIGYASDSNQHWRGTDLDALLRSKRHPRLQLLIHPMWWRAQYSPMLEKLRELAAELGVELDELLTPEQRALTNGHG